MLIKDSFHDIPTSTTPMRIHVFKPTLPPQFQPSTPLKFPGLILFSEIYQVTGPVKRLARRLAGEGFIVLCPSVFHDYEGPREMQYTAADTALGNKYKLLKPLRGTDEDLRLTVDFLEREVEGWSGRVGSCGICYGGHLSVRAALDPRVSACVSFFGTDIHSGTLSPNGDDTLVRVGGGEVPEGTELLLVFGKLDGHVPRAGRDKIRAALDARGVRFTWLELSCANHAFVRDEDEKGRYDPAITQICISLMLELFSRTLR